MEARHRLSVVIVDDDPDYREVLRTWLAHGHSMRCVAECGTGDAGVRLVANCRPDVAIVDLRLPHLSGSQVIKCIKSVAPRVCVVAVTGFTDGGDAIAAIEAGTDGVVYKPDFADRMNDLAGTIVKARSGHSMLSEGIQTILTRELRLRSCSSLERALQRVLSPRERDLVQCWSEGMGDKQIADKLGITQSTVNTYHKHIFSKLQVHSRMEAMARLLWRLRGENVGFSAQSKPVVAARHDKVQEGGR